MTQATLFGDRLAWARDVIAAADPDEPTGAPGPGQVEYAVLALDGQTRHLARTDGPDTSAEAVERMDATGALAGQRGAVLAALRAHPGCTSAELAEAMGVDRVITARRLPDLRSLGHVVEGEPRPCRVNPGNAKTWRAA